MASMSKSRYEEIAQKMRGIPPEKPGSSYEWEELVQKLCASNDAGLRDIGVRELEILRRKCLHHPIFNKQ